MQGVVRIQCGRLSCVGEVITGMKAHVCVFKSALTPPMVPQAILLSKCLFFTLYTFCTGCSMGRSARVRSSKCLWLDRQRSNAAERVAWACAVVHTICALAFYGVVFRCSANVAKVTSAAFSIIQMHQKQAELVHCGPLWKWLWFGFGEPIVFWVCWALHQI